MSIAIQIDDAFDIETYSGLQAYIIAHLELDSESSLQVPTFIRKAESRLDRVITSPQKDSVATLSTVAGQQTVTLPADFRQLRTAWLMTDPGYALAPVTMNVLHGGYSDCSGAPIVYAYSFSDLNLGPVPDAEYSIRIFYQARIPALSDSSETNWLLTQHPDAYVYAALVEACGWLEDFDAAAIFNAKLDTIIGEINAQGNRYRLASPMRLRSPVVV